MNRNSIIALATAFVATAFLTTATANGALCELAICVSAMILSPLIVASIAVSPRLIRCLIALVVFKCGYAKRARWIIGPDRLEAKLSQLNEGRQDV